MQGNVEAGKELAKLKLKAESTNSLREEDDQYNVPSTFVAQITKQKASLEKGDKHWKKASEDATEVCQAFEVDQNVLQHKKDDQTNILKGLEEEVVAAGQKYEEFLQRVVNVVYRVRIKCQSKHESFTLNFLLLFIIWIPSQLFLERMPGCFGARR